MPGTYQSVRSHQARTPAGAEIRPRDEGAGQTLPAMVARATAGDRIGNGLHSRRELRQ